MPILIRKINGEIFTNNIGNVLYLRPINGQIQREDYINVHGFIAYLQNLTKVCETALAEKPLNFGLVNTLSMQVLEFCYENDEPTIDDTDDSIEYYMEEQTSL